MHTPSHDPRPASHSVRISNVFDPSDEDREAYDGPGDPTGRLAAQEHRRQVPAAELDDDELRRQTAEAFRFYRESLDDDTTPADESQRHRLAELQGESLRRSPGVELPRLELDQAPRSRGSHRQADPAAGIGMAGV